MDRIMKIDVYDPIDPLDQLNPTLRKNQLNLIDPIDLTIRRNQKKQVNSPLMS